MDTGRINYILREYKQYVGAFPSNRLPTVQVRPYCLIVNTDPEGEKGEHWNAIYIDEKNHGEFFDPYGYSPLVYDIHKYMVTTCASWTYNTIQFQSLKPTSVSCGHICVLYLLIKIQKGTLHQFYKIYTKFRINDKNVMNIIQNMEYIYKLYKLFY